MTWATGNEDQVIENLDVYLSNIKTAKEELDRVNKQFNEVNDAKNRIVSDNQDLLKEKIADLEAKQQELQGLIDFNADLKAKNKQDSEDLNKAKDDILAETNQVELGHQKKEKEFANKEDILAAREADIKQMENENSSDRKDIDARIEENKQLLAQFMQEHKDAQDLMKEVLNERQVTIDLSKKAQDDLQEAQALNSQAISLNEMADQKLADARVALEDSRKNKKDAADALAAVMNEKEGLRDMIIESKRAKVMSQDIITNAQKSVNEANLKIAELNELKTALAEQEKKNVT